MGIRRTASCAGITSWRGVCPSAARATIVGDGACVGLGCPPSRQYCATFKHGGSFFRRGRAAVAYERARFARAAACRTTLAWDAGVSALPATIWLPALQRSSLRCAACLWRPLLRSCAARQRKLSAWECVVPSGTANGAWCIWLSGALSWRRLRLWERLAVPAWRWIWIRRRRALPARAERTLPGWLQLSAICRKRGLPSARP